MKFEQLSKIHPTLIKATIYASISGLIFGYNMGIVSGALSSLQSSFELTSAQAESVSSFFFIGLMTASPFGGYSCDRWGRRSSIIYMDFGFLVAAFMLLTAPSYGTVLAGRFILGCTSGISLISAVSYLTEVASAAHDSHRGAFVSAVDASISLGFLLAYLTSYSFIVVLEYEEGWRYLFGVGIGLLASLQWIGMRKMPESPEWLSQKGFHEKAHEALRLITFSKRDSSDKCENTRFQINVESEVHDESDILHATLQRHVELEYGDVIPFSLDDYPSISHYSRQAIIIAILAIAEQLCGHINIINYAPVIFAEAFYDFDETQATEYNGSIPSELLTTTIVLGVVKFVVTLFVLFEVDNLGRLFLMKAGAGIVTVSLLFLVIGFSAKLENADETEFGATEYIHTPFQHTMVLIGCTGCVAGFALSYGPITWLLVAELSPSSIRGRLLGFYTVLTHGCAAVVSYTFLSGQDKYGESVPFLFYFCFSLLATIFIAIAVPETGGVTCGDGEDVESLLDEMWFWGDDNPMTNVCRYIINCGVRCNEHRQKRRGEELGRIESCFDDADGSIRRSGHGSVEFV